jgi:hypothetical protein
MRRRLFALLSAGSFLVFVGLAGWWVRAQFGDELWVRCVGHSLVLYGADGAEAASAPGYFFEPEPGARAVYEGPSGLLRLLRAGRLRTARSDFAGVEMYADSAHNPPRSRAVVVPVAYPLALAAVLPLAWAVARTRRHRRGAAGLCPTCGYDLRASPGRCPECGAEPATAEGG